MNDWILNLQDLPLDEPFLVFLAEEATGTRVHVAINLKIVNGYLLIVGGNMAYDMPQILMWHPMIDLPQPKRS